MAGLLLRTAATLAILLVVLLVHGEMRIEGQPGDGTAVRGKRRQKREWVKFARPCREEEDNSKRNPIAQISSDFHVNQKITYRITGIGVDQPPVGIFVVDRTTGAINITSIVDREKTPNFHITCHALNAYGQDVEKPLVLTVKILDINDNPPVFSQEMFMGEIEENSPSNSLVMVLNATDADEPNHLNSKIAFKIVSQEPAGVPMFLMSRHSGEVRTLTSSLDREQVSGYHLIVSGADRDGEGLSSQCQSSIKVKDVNDNFPVFKESQYSASIKENALSSELLRFQVVDLDEEFTDNWLAVYFFTSGNEGNWFEIQTDARTNEGVLKVVKPFDYEQLQNAHCSVAVKNKAEFHRSVVSQYRIQSTQVKVHIINVQEGIAFRPASKTFTVQKGISRKRLINYILGTYTAIDEDTNKIASNVRYALGRNDGGFLIIDSKTAEIRFAKNMARDSTFIGNRTITAEVLAIDENTGKTSTGTVYVEVPGFNEHCPTTVLEKERVCGSSPSVVVSARARASDGDTGPYVFSLEEESEGVKLPAVWRVTTLNATAAMLAAQPPLSPGRYPISLVVTDRQNRQCDTPDSLAVEVCQCDNRDTCAAAPQPGPRYGDPPPGRLGPSAIGLILLGLLMLLLAPLLLLACDCGKGPAGGVTAGFIPVPEGSEGTIHQWGIEGAQPEDKEITNICVPLITSNGADFVESSDVCMDACARGVAAEGASGMELSANVGAAAGAGAAAGFGAAAGLGFCSAGRTGTTRTRHSTAGTLRDCGEGAVSMSFLESYFSQKAFACAEEDGGREASDCLLVYDSEGLGGPGSPAGSLGCCSFIADDLDDGFLDALGPKFKRLAEISLGLGGGEGGGGHSGELGRSEPCSGQAPAAGGPGACAWAAPGPALRPAVSIPDPLRQGGCCLVTEEETCSAPRPALRPAVSIPDPLRQGGCLVTEEETYSASGAACGSLLRPPAAAFDPLLVRQQSVVVTERVACPTGRGHLRGASELRGPCSLTTCAEDPCSRLI